jgi:glycosyltransferase involved in cell wall biosynthesis
MRFTVYTTCYNAGDKLNKTVKSVLNQTYMDYEIIIKDGKSTDGCVDDLLQDPEVTAAVAAGKIRLMVEKDNGVYDGMNQALSWIKGDYVIFMNCGDAFFDENVLLKTSAYIESERNVKSEREGTVDILYGDVYCENRNAVDPAPRKLDGFTCYRNIPCHQACFYKKELFSEKQYDTDLKIRADYDHFLWCVYKQNAKAEYMGFTVASYEGDGISETKQNEKVDQQEHELIIRRYMSETEIHSYKTKMALTLLPLRKRLARSKIFSSVYGSIKETIYRYK